MEKPIFLVYKMKSYNGSVNYAIGSNIDDFTPFLRYSSIKDTAHALKFTLGCLKKVFGVNFTPPVDMFLEGENNKILCRNFPLTEEEIKELWESFEEFQIEK